ncbi:MAG: fibronectin type III domain-containing protein, partial [bacterium]|nr:fibronectin type III domain-containing protein [bacterium]
TLITNNTAVITRIEDTLNGKGTYFSEIYDLGIQSKLGKIYWDAETAAGTSVSLAVRTGNSNVPDATWSKWSAPFADSENANIDTSGVRYFQVKTVLNSTNLTTSPRLNNYRVYYVQSNLGPKLRKIDIKKQTGKNPDIITVSAPGKTGTARPAKPSENHLSLRWSASDPNKDKLKYNLFLKRTSDKTWLLFKKDITGSTTLLDTKLFEDGKYLLKVTADDALANPPGTDKSNSLVSSPFLIDSTAPELAGFTLQGSRASYTVTDKTSLVARVLYSYDGKLWFPVFPVDIIADSRSEKYNFTLKNRSAEDKYIFIKVTDEFNNSKVFQKEL